MSSNARRLNILMLPKWYPNRFDILDGVFVIDHIRAVSRKHNVAVLFVHNDPDLKEKRKVLFSDQNNLDEWTVYFRSPKTGLRPLDKLLIGLSYVRTQFWMWRQIRKKWGTPDVVHVHVLLRSGILALWLRMIKKIPFIITEHWSGYDPTVGYPIGKMKRRMLKYALRKASAVTAVSDYLKNHIGKMATPKNLVVIPNACDETLFTIRHEKRNIKKKLVHVSTLDDYPKNFGNILRAIATLAAERSDFELIVIGKGVEREKQETLAAELGILNTFVFFLGLLTKEQVAQKISESDLFVLFSHYETQSCVVIESLFCGIPVIAPRLGGVQELITGDNGILVSPGNSEDFCSAIRSVLDEKICFRSEKVRSTAARFSYNRAAQGFDAVYFQAIDKA